LEAEKPMSHQFEALGATVANTKTTCAATVGQTSIANGDEILTWQKQPVRLDELTFVEASPGQSLRLQIWMQNVNAELSDPNDNAMLETKCGCVDQAKDGQLMSEAKRQARLESEREGNLEGTPFLLDIGSKTYRFENWETYPGKGYRCSASEYQGRAPDAAGTAAGCLAAAEEMAGLGVDYATFWGGTCYVCSVGGDVGAKLTAMPGQTSFMVVRNAVVQNRGGPNPSPSPSSSLP
jgi:hypothetical protein